MTCNFVLVKYFSCLCGNSYKQKILKCVAPDVVNQ